MIRVRHRRLQQSLDCDVAVCGGTLGLLLALAIQASTIMSAEASEILWSGQKKQTNICSQRGTHVIACTLNASPCSCIAEWCS